MSYELSCLRGPQQSRVKHLAALSWRRQLARRMERHSIWTCVQDPLEKGRHPLATDHSTGTFASSSIVGQMRAIRLLTLLSWQHQLVRRVEQHSILNLFNSSDQERGVTPQYLTPMGWRHQPVRRMKRHSI